MAAHARLKNEFTEDKKCQNLMRRLIFSGPLRYCAHSGLFRIYSTAKGSNGEFRQTVAAMYSVKR